MKKILLLGGLFVAINMVFTASAATLEGAGQRFQINMQRTSTTTSNVTVPAPKPTPPPAAQAPLVPLKPNPRTAIPKAPAKKPVATPPVHAAAPVAHKDVVLRPAVVETSTGATMTTMSGVTLAAPAVHESPTPVVQQPAAPQDATLLVVSLIIGVFMLVALLVGGIMMYR